MTTIANVQDITRLRYYVNIDGTYFYDDIDEMPNEPIAECQPVPSITSRCTFPYHSQSSTAPFSFNFSRNLVIFLWSVWYLINNYYLILIETITTIDKNNCHYVKCTNARNSSRNSIKVSTSVINKSCNNKSSSRHHSKRRTKTNSSNNNCKSKEEKISSKYKCICNKKNDDYHIYYYYNFNLNDWWRRWNCSTSSTIHGSSL